MHCYKTNLFIFPYLHKKLVFRYGQSVTSERQRDNYCVDIPGHGSITVSANCPHCPTLPHHAPATILAQESPQFPRHQPLGPDDTRDQELTFL